jgi:hypothetical protein
MRGRTHRNKVSEQEMTCLRRQQLGSALCRASMLLCNDTEIFQRNRKVWHHTARSVFFNLQVALLS